MPVLAYLWKVGAALLALLFVADFFLPRAPLEAPPAEKTAEDRQTIRIHSDRKWPERVELDTSQPTIFAATPELPITQPPAIRADTPAVADALAMARTESSPRETVNRKQPRKAQHIATRPKRHASPQMLLAARPGQFAWFGYYRYW
ncbi:hypothetical protein [Bradyrhizobium sp. NAS80.1]|uniref:hypothetical protein n=1 Tax=Bradyrhizobium sp. NAS80.1 TaxID=1680159 RepID=UPI00116101F1|nr:hypothetical protein [Bradyrhizobium sp. NAS80.1]